MGIEKQGSKGFLQMFDWNAKSRKKLFSSKPDAPEQSKQKKRCDGNLPMTCLHMLDDEDGSAAGSSGMKGSSDHSCASSVIDEDICGTRGPGVVARLMGLDSLPKSNISEPYSTPFFNSQSLRDAYYQTKTSQSQTVSWSSDTGPNYQKVIHKPIEKFQAEVLPPKSARSIPITHHKLLSPIKSANFVLSKDAARIMEVAARIIEPGPPPRVGSKMKLHSVGSSSVPLTVSDLKEKVVKAAQKRSKLFEGSQRKDESCAVKSLRGHSVNKGLNGAVPNLEEFSVGVKSKGKSISLALQAKANVQKREGLSLNDSRRPVSLKEPCEVSPNQLFKDQSTTQKSVIKKQCAQNGLSVLRQNNQKQNCIIDRGKSSSKCSSKCVKPHVGEPASARQPSSSKLPGTSKVSPGNSGSDVKDDKREVFSRIARRKPSIGRKCHSERSKPSHSIRADKNGKAIQSSAVMDMQSSWNQDSRRMGTDVISFTFTAPMARSDPDSSWSAEAQESSKISLGSQSIMSPLSSDGSCTSKFTFPGCNVKGSDALSILLEQKLKELADKVEFSQQKSGTVLHDMEHCLGGIMSSNMQDNQVLEDMSSGDSNISQTRKLLDCHLPSPVSVLEPFSFEDICISSDAADTNSIEGSKQSSSSLQAQHVLNSYSLTSVPIEGDVELSDSALSANMQETTIASTENRRHRNWELDYVKEIMCNIEPMFMNYALGRANEVINPHLYDQLGNQKHYANNSKVVTRMHQRLMFDCVCESLNKRCVQVVCRGFKSWTKGVLMVRHKDRLAGEVCKEILDWSAVSDSMIDELVDQDMSSPNGKWLDFDTEAFELGTLIESRLLNSLINEVIEDILVH